MVVSMADEYYERYKHLSHQELYRTLQAGSANQVDTVADTWASIGDTVSAISATLQQDLKRLLPDWTSQGSREFHYRLDLIARYAQTLADEASAMRTGLTVMASSLRETQRRAEPPSAGHDAAFAVGHLLDGVVGTNLGRVLPAAEKAQAHERMVRLIARLAAHYGVADHGTWPLMVPEAPIDLPASGVSTGLAGGAGLIAGNPRHHGHGHDRDRDRDRIVTVTVIAAGIGIETGATDTAMGSVPALPCIRTSGRWAPRSSAAPRAGHSTAGRSISPATRSASSYLRAAAVTMPPRLAAQAAPEVPAAAAAQVAPARAALARAVPARAVLARAAPLARPAVRPAQVAPACRARRAAQRARAPRCRWHPWAALLLRQGSPAAEVAARHSVAVLVV